MMCDAPVGNLGGFATTATRTKTKAQRSNKYRPPGRLGLAGARVVSSQWACKGLDGRKQPGLPVVMRCRKKDSGKKTNRGWIWAVVTVVIKLHYSGLSLSYRAYTRWTPVDLFSCDSIQSRTWKIATESIIRVVVSRQHGRRSLGVSLMFLETQERKGVERTGHRQCKGCLFLSSILSQPQGCV